MPVVATTVVWGSCGCNRRAIDAEAERAATRSGFLNLLCSKWLTLSFMRPRRVDPPFRYASSAADRQIPRVDNRQILPIARRPLADGLPRLSKVLLTGSVSVLFQFAGKCADADPQGLGRLVAVSAVVFQGGFDQLAFHVP